MLLKKFQTKIISDTKDNLVNQPHYVFVSKFTPWDNELQPPLEKDTCYDNQLIKQELIFGQKITPNDVAFVREIPVWQYGDVIPMYDDKNENKDWFIINSNNDVYICLDNNGGIISTDEPISRALVAFETVDGYKWKYLFSITSADITKFSTGNYYPISSNPDVVSAALPYSIETILVENGGSGYKTTSGIVQEVINNTRIRIENDKPSVNDYFNGYSIVFETGPSAGEVREIVSYEVNSDGIFINYNPSATVDLTTQYRIVPTVEIKGSGTGATAICHVDSAAETITSIEVKNPGQDYSYVEASIKSNDLHGTGAIIRPIISPAKGFGANPVEEMGCSEIEVSVEFFLHLPTNVSYRQTGIITDITDLLGNAFAGDIFKAYHNMTITMDGSIPFDNNEIIRGLTTGAKGIVINATTDALDIAMLYGDFNIGETLYGETSNRTATCNTITEPDINKYNNKIYTVKNVEVVDRNFTTKEIVRQIIRVQK